MKIIVDIMGGDRSPDEQLLGVRDADSRFPGHEYLLVGDASLIAERSGKLGVDLSRFEIKGTDSVITMEDDPMVLLRSKKTSSMTVGLKLLAAGEGDAFVSCGNTGALFTGASVLVRSLPGISRASIGTLLHFANPLLLMDSGANLTITPEQYEQFALMGSTYMEKMLGVPEARIGLLNNGTEAHKGTPDRIEAYRRLSVFEGIRFVGNVESHSAINGGCDVLVTDGFSGNLFLKAVEGMGTLILKTLKETITTGWKNQIAAKMLEKDLHGMKKRFDAKEYGGAPILGLKKPVIKAHGSSDAYAFSNAIRQAIFFAESGYIEALTARLEQHWLSAEKNQEREEPANE